MKSRIVSFMGVIVVLSMLLTACGATPTATEAPVAATVAPVVATEAPVVATEAPVVATEAPAAAPTEVPAPAINAKDQKVALVSVQERGDHGVIDALVDGLISGASQLGYGDAKVIVVSDPATYTSTLQQVAESGYTLIIATFPPLIDAVKTVAPSFPNTHFVLLDAALGAEMPNVQELFFLENESSYLAGVAAGMMTKTNKVGFIGSIPQDVVDRYAIGFYEGAHAANPQVVVCWTYAGSLQDPAKGKETALSFFSQGMDIIHAATAGTQLGIYEASKQEKKFMISADVDVIPLNPEFGLFATGPKFDEAIRLQLRSQLDGTWKPGHQTYGLATGLVGLTPFNQAIVPIEVQQAVLKAKQDIIDGKIKVDDDRKLKELTNCS